MSDTTFTILCSFITGILTLAFTKGIDAYRGYLAELRLDKAQLSEEETKICDKEENTLRWLLGRQDATIERLQKELHELHLQHNDCEKKHEALRVRLELLEQRVKYQVEHQPLPGMNP